MRLFLIYCIALLLGCVNFSSDWGSKKEGLPKQVAKTDPVISFKGDVEPILLNRCQPCHFKGGKMHHELPFDTASTVLKLREQLFSRIKDSTEQAKIKLFLAQNE